MLGLFAVQFVLPSVLTRLLLAIVFLLLAVDVLFAERRLVRPVLSTLLGKPGRSESGSDDQRRRSPRHPPDGNLAS
jgi:hypothetical protein